MTEVTVTFGTITLPSPSLEDAEARLLISRKKLLSGKTSLQGSTEYSLSFTFRCMTETYADITAMLGKIGASETLTINAETHTKCMISAFGHRRIRGGDEPAWEYTVSFEQDTTT